MKLINANMPDVWTITTPCDEFTAAVSAPNLFHVMLSDGNTTETYNSYETTEVFVYIFPIDDADFYLSVNFTVIHRKLRGLISNRDLT